MNFQDFKAWIEREDDNLKSFYKNGNIYQISDVDYNNYLQKLFDVVQMIEDKYRKLPYKFSNGALYYLINPTHFLLLVGDFVDRKFSTITYTNTSVVLITV